MCVGFALIFFPCKIALAEKHYDDDCTTTYGDYLGTNYIFDVEPKELHVLGDRSLGLHMYASPDLKSEPIHTLESGMRVELLDSRPNAFMVSHAIGSDDGEVTHGQSKKASLCPLQDGQMVGQQSCQAQAG